MVLAAYAARAVLFNTRKFLNKCRLKIGRKRNIIGVESFSQRQKNKIIVMLNLL